MSMPKYMISHLMLKELQHRAQRLSPHPDWPDRVPALQSPWLLSLRQHSSNMLRDIADHLDLTGKRWEPASAPPAPQWLVRESPLNGDIPLTLANDRYWKLVEDACLPEVRRQQVLPTSTNARDRGRRFLRRTWLGRSLPNFPSVADGVWHLWSFAPGPRSGGDGATTTRPPARAASTLSGSK
jgi:hypothetical protein